VYNFNSFATLVCNFILILKEGGCVVVIKINKDLGSFYSGVTYNFINYQVKCYKAQPGLSELMGLVSR